MGETDFKPGFIDRYVGRLENQIIPSPSNFSSLRGAENSKTKQTIDLKKSKLLAILPILGITASLHSAVVYTGGMYSKGNIAGMSDLAVPTNSYNFRNHDGRLYIHELGWAHSSSDVQAALPGLFPAAPIWESSMPASHALNQLSTQLKPKWATGAWCLTVNGAVDSTTDFTTLLDGKAGLTYRVAPILSPNTGEWQTYPWSSTRWNQYRANCSAGLALSTDSPPYFYLVQPDGYKQFTADQIIWGNNANNVNTLLYLSPGSSTNFLHQALTEIQDLSNRYAVPITYVISSYYSSATTNSAIHYIGSENGNANEVMRVANEVNNTY